MAAALLVAGSVAVADVAPPNVAPCAGLSAGAACVDDEGNAGTCVSQRLTRPDYSEGPPPTSVEVDVLVCTAGAARSASSLLGVTLASVVGLTALVVVRSRRAGRRSPATAPAGR